MEKGGHEGSGQRVPGEPQKDCLVAEATADHEPDTTMSEGSGEGASMIEIHG